VENSSELEKWTRRMSHGVIKVKVKRLNSHNTPTCTSSNNWSEPVLQSGTCCTSTYLYYCRFLSMHARYGTRHGTLVWLFHSPMHPNQSRNAPFPWSTLALTTRLRWLFPASTHRETEDRSWLRDSLTDRSSPAAHISTTCFLITVTVTLPVGCEILNLSTQSMHAKINSVNHSYPTVWTITHSLTVIVHSPQNL